MGTDPDFASDLTTLVELSEDHAYYLRTRLAFVGEATMRTTTWIRWKDVSSPEHSSVLYYTAWDYRGMRARSQRKRVRAKAANFSIGPCKRLTMACQESGPLRAVWGPGLVLVTRQILRFIRMGMYTRGPAACQWLQTIRETFPSFAALDLWVD